MSEKAGVTGELERLLSTLESLLEPGGQREIPAGDAIDAVLASPARATAVRSLQSAPEIEAFRQALVDGLIRADTANQLLRLVNELVGQLIR